MRRKILFCVWVLFWLVAGGVAVEFLSRRLLVPWHQEIGNRHMQPYLMSGGYYQAPAPGAPSERFIMGPSGPETYGYSRQGDIYTYGFEEEVSSIADRGDFLFQDRVHLANDQTRKDLIRIFVIGGSAAYGVGASSPERRWYAVLERGLSSALAREVRLIPAAMIGYGSTQERLVLDLMVLPRRPDAVIILDGFNDAALPAIFGNRPGDPYDQAVLYADFYSPFFGLKKKLAEFSYVYRYLLHRSMAKSLAANEQRILDNPQLLKNYARSTAGVYLDNIRHMMERCRDQGVPCGVFLQPVRDLTWRYQGKREPLDRITLAAYDQIRQGIQGVASERSIHDLTSVFDGAGQEQWYRDNVHFKDPGHEAVANAMQPIVLDMLKAKLHQPSRGNRH